jgi:AraC-like DNA-binding protein
MEMTQNNSSYSLEVFPVPRVEMAFTYGGENSLYGQWGTEGIYQVQDAVIDGFFHRKVTYSSDDRSFGGIVVGFKPWGINPYLDVDIGAFTDQNVNMEHFYLQKTRMIKDRLRTVHSDEERIAVIEQFLLDIIRPHEPDALIRQAIRLIGRSHCHTPVRSLAKHFNLSEKQFKRRFIKTVGIPPKFYMRIVRLQYILRLMDSMQFSTLDIALESGFFDQAHFIKEFKEFTNFTPKEYLIRKQQAELNDDAYEQINKSVFYNTVCK